MNFKSLAQIVDTAAKEAKPVEQLSKQTSFNVDESYAIQKEAIQLRYDRGEKFIGVKLGFTSKAKMEQMGVHDMIWGILTDDMLFENGTTLPFSKFIHPRAEPEICFRTKKDLPAELSLETAPDYIDGIAAAIEIIDSRYQNFKFSLEDVIADNCSSSGLVIGDWHPVDTPVQDLAIQMSFDGKEVASGNSNAILGNPWESMVAAARLTAKYSQKVPAGSLIMAGAATAAVYLESGPKGRSYSGWIGKGLIYA
jgi:2-oxo-3-hexenedioate decarboxylase